MVCDVNDTHVVTQSSEMLDYWRKHPVVMSAALLSESESFPVVIEVIFFFVLFCFSVYCLYHDVLKKTSVTITHAHMPVVKIVEAFGKICPLGYQNQWIMLPFCHGAVRCWFRKFPMRIIDDVYLYGSSSVIDANPIRVYKLIADVDCWANWNPSLFGNLTYHPFAGGLIREDSWISVVSVSDQFGNIAGYGFSSISANNVSWILFCQAKEIKKQMMSFFLIQPFQSSEEKCLLTYITGYIGLLHKQDIASERNMFTLASIKETLEVVRADVLPFSFSSAVDDKNIYESEKEIEQTEEFIQRSSAYLVLHSFQQGLWRKEIKNFSLTLDLLKMKPDITSGTTSSAESQQQKAQGISISSEQSLEGSVEFSDDASEGHGDKYYKKFIEHSSKTEARRKKYKGNNTSNITQELLRMKLLKQASHRADKRSFSLGDDVFIDDTKNGLERRNNSCIDPINISGNCAFPTHLSPSEFEILLPELPLSCQRMTDLKTKGNHCASEVLAQVLETKFCLNDLQSSIDKSDRHIRTSGGWLFHSSVKGMVLLFKPGYSGSLKTISYLCSIKIPVKLIDVWEAIKNPRARFICDESVKKVQVLDIISHDQKIVYVYHEANHLLKKEAIDFCLLHTERVENSKHCIVFCSIEFENCPLMEGVTRGTILPCGFIVEPADEQTTRVTYLYQIIMNNPNSTFFQELSSSVPDYLFNLKYYLMSKPV